MSVDAATYEVVFEQGPLGLKLAPVPSCLCGVGGLVLGVTGAAAASGRIATHDVLVAANDFNLRVTLNQHSTPRMNFRVTMGLLEQAERPLTLHFQRLPGPLSDAALAELHGDAETEPPPSRSDSRDFDAAWFVSGAGKNGGPSAGIAGTYTVPFGDGPLGLGLMDRSPEASAEVELIQAAAASCGKIAVGDVIVAVNDNDTSQLSFRETRALLLESARPVQVTFRSEWRWDESEFKTYFR